MGAVFDRRLLVSRGAGGDRRRKGHRLAGVAAAVCLAGVGAGSAWSVGGLAGVVHHVGCGVVLLF